MKRRLSVELDGRQRAEQAAGDEQRTVYLQQQDFAALRFWNDQVLRNTDGLLAGVLYQLV